MRELTAFSCRTACPVRECGSTTFEQMVPAGIAGSVRNEIGLVILPQSYRSYFNKLPGQIYCLGGIYGVT